MIAGRAVQRAVDLKAKVRAGAKAARETGAATAEEEDHTKEAKHHRLQRLCRKCRSHLFRTTKASIRWLAKFG